MPARLVATVLVSALLAVPSAAGVDWLAPPSDGSHPELPASEGRLSPPHSELGHAIGERFTHHHQILDYLRKLASASDRVELWEYGQTYEERPLVLMAISSPANILRLDEIRRNHLLRAAGGESPAAAGEPAVVWLSYGIHGNEASSAETAMATAFLLADAGGDWSKRLEDVVVLIDPLTNPDGRERYVHSFEERVGRRPDPYAGSAEHREPWPGGRQNHYLIDLNRDWAWATQRESHDRLLEYRRWEPHVYVDFHEMSSRSTYFFPPAAEPVHSAISKSTVLWLETFGRANARAFDRQGWLYYVGENFDLFYPGYGDSYPSLRGAVGMTYEMAGHSRAGLVVEHPDGTYLSLADRVARHLTTSLTTVETAAANRLELIRDFHARRRDAASTEIRTYVWESDQPEADAAARLLAIHGLEPRRTTVEQRLKVRSLAGESHVATTRTFAPGTWVLSTAHPLGSLAKNLVEPVATMPSDFLARQRQRIERNREPEFFDITAWSLPVAFNLEVFVSPGSPTIDAKPGIEAGTIVGSGSLGFLIPPRGLAGYTFVAAALTRGIRARLSLAEFTDGGRRFPRGTVVLPQRGNPENLEKHVSELVTATGIVAVRIASALSDSGVSLGSDAVVPLRPPRIGLVAGQGVQATSFGFLWHLLDRDLEVSHHRLPVASLKSADLEDLDVLILPSGSGYGTQFDDELAPALKNWVHNGGILIAIGGAIEWLQDADLTIVKKWTPEIEESAGGQRPLTLTPEKRELHTPGAAVASVFDPSSPLTVGLESAPPVLFRGRTILLPTGNPKHDVMVVDSALPVVAGFAWPEAEERLRGALLIGLEQHGRGAVILFAQDPVFRLFWRGTAAPLLNALLYAPSLAEHRRLFR